MSDNWSVLDGGRFLADLYARDSIQATFLQRIINAINGLGARLGTNPVGLVQPPPPINAVNVAVSGEMLHVSLSHNTPVNIHCHYFVEVGVNDPNFTQPLVHYLGPSRTGAPISLPANDGSGNQHTYYVRAYAQYLGSKPSTKTVFGGILGPAAVTMTGATNLTLLASTGSGTASPTGQQGGFGFGKFPKSQAIPKVGKSSVPGIVAQQSVTGQSQQQTGSSLFPLVMGSGNPVSAGWNVVTTESVSLASNVTAVQLALSYNILTYNMTPGYYISQLGFSITSGAGPSTPQAYVNAPALGASANATLNDPPTGSGLTLTLYYFGSPLSTFNEESFTESVTGVIITT